MKILIVCSGNVNNFNFEIHHAFIHEQIESVKSIYEIEYDVFLVKGKGIKGYLKNIPYLRKKINNYSPDIVHAHFGLSGLVACLQRKRPVITFHGSEAYIPYVGRISNIAGRLSAYNIYVGEKIRKRIKGHKNGSIVPCGINLDTFYPIEMKIAREKLNFDFNKKYILFSSSFSNTVKNSPLAFSAVNMLNINCEFIELKNKSREEVNLMVNACNLLLLTSTSEGSPQVIKEAMACNCPIVATDVGDIKEVIGKTKGCYITSFDPVDVADKIQQALNFGKRTDGREKILRFDNKIIAKQIFDIYQIVLGKK